MQSAPCQNQAADAQTDAIIELRGIRKTFHTANGAFTALNGIDLSIRRGEIFGIIGMSGAGKSTLVRCINLLERPTEGEVVLDKQNLSAMPEKALSHARRNIGMVFQQFNLLMQRTAESNVAFALEIAGVPRDERKKRVTELLKLVELTDKAQNYPSQLSGGQKQRVAIARALATQPSILLCDEATSALDPQTTRSILALLQQINRELGITIVIITHEMKVIQEVCHRVAVIEDGRIAEVGDVEAMFAAPKTDAARRLFFPVTRTDEEEDVLSNFKGCYRIVFDGATVEEPIIAGMILACGDPVSILYANTQEVHGKIFGQLIFRMPDDPAAGDRVHGYLAMHGLQAEEVASQ